MHECVMNKNDAHTTIIIFMHDLISKQINENAIEIMEKFFDNKYRIILTESIIEDLPILRISKKQA